MPSNYEFGYIDYCITQLSAVEDAFNVYRETGSLDALNRLNANAESKPFLPSINRDFRPIRISCSTVKRTGAILWTSFTLSTSIGAAFTVR